MSLKSLRRKTLARGRHAVNRLQRWHAMCDAPACLTSQPCQSLHLSSALCPPTTTVPQSGDREVKMAARRGRRAVRFFLLDRDGAPRWCCLQLLSAGPQGWVEEMTRPITLQWLPTERLQPTASQPHRALSQASSSPWPSCVWQKLNGSRKGTFTLNRRRHLLLLPLSATTSSSPCLILSSHLFLHVFTLK